jgi:hypothetical protein
VVLRPAEAVNSNITVAMIIVLDPHSGAGASILDNGQHNVDTRVKKVHDSLTLGWLEGG